MRWQLLIVVALLLAPAPAHADEIGAIVAEGDLLAAAGDADGALAKYEKALTRDPDRLAIYDRATPLWIGAERWSVAIAWLEKATLREPDYAAGWYALGYLYRRTGRVAAAVLAYEEYAALRPNDAAGRFGLAVAREVADQPEAALADYRRYLAIELDASRATYRAQARAAIERLSPAAASWQAALTAVLTGRATVAGWRAFAKAR